MKLPLSWLTDYTNIDGVSIEQYNAAMTMSGSKVECIEYLGQDITNVITGKILSVEDHPDSDHLKICQIDAGQAEPVQIVTGAPNVTATSVGEICPVALHKSTLPGGIKITKGKLRGILSNGMMCSFQELGLEHGCVPYACENGILFLPHNTAVGVDIKTVLGLDEYVVDFEITSNRPDCLSIIGLARETAATFKQPFHIRKPMVTGCGDRIDKYIRVCVDEPKLCPRYTAKIVKNIRIEPSPAWLRERLHAVGVRPINNIVDITNYVMFEYGQPMHAFDYNCLCDGQIVVRRPKPNEFIETLDGQTRIITPEMLAICDGQKPVAVAGVMGGANSEITDSTKTVVLESACFHGATVRITAKSLGMRTEASGRFEKGLDPSLTMPAVLRACELIEQLGAGQVVDGVVDVCAADLSAKTLPFEPEKINALLGTDIPAAEQINLLNRLNFEVCDNKVVIPSFRIDIARMCDLAEEVARIYGYDNIPVRLYAGGTTQGGLTRQQQLEHIATSVCLSAGFDEAMSHSFISPKFYDAINLASDDVRRISTTILNPLGEDFSIMRTTVLPSILDSLAHNNAHRNPTASLYEVGTTYTPQIMNGEVDITQLPEEKKMLTLGSYGRIEFYQFKGIIESICQQLNIKPVTFVRDTQNSSYHPGRCAKIYVGDDCLGTFGTIHPLVAKKYGFSVEVLTAELAMDILCKVSNPVKQYQPLPKFPASVRDIAVLVNDEVPVADLEAAITMAVGNILEGVLLFDVYKGVQVPAGKKSVAYSMRLRASDHTLTDEECDKAMRSAITALETKFEASLRV